MPLPSIFGDIEPTCTDAIGSESPTTACAGKSLGTPYGSQIPFARFRDCRFRYGCRRGSQSLRLLWPARKESGSSRDQRPHASCRISDREHACISGNRTRIGLETCHSVARVLDGFLRGATIALLAFAACIAVHAILVLVRMDAGAAVWLTLAAALFGGFAFGIPAMLVGGVTGALCMQGWRRDG